MSRCCRRASQYEASPIKCLNCLLITLSPVFLPTMADNSNLSDADKVSTLRSGHPLTPHRSVSSVSPASAPPPPSPLRPSHSNSPRPAVLPSLITHPPPPQDFLQTFLPLLVPHPPPPPLCPQNPLLLPNLTLKPSNPSFPSPPVFLSRDHHLLVPPEMNRWVRELCIPSQSSHLSRRNTRHGRPRRLGKYSLLH